MIVAKRISRTRAVLLAAAIALFAALVRLPSLTQPLGPDQGIMTVIGAGLLNGELPYRDNWEMASPAIFFTYAAIFKLFGRSMMAVALADLVVAVITALLIYALAAFVFGRAAGAVGALLFAVFSTGVCFGMHSGGDVAFGTFWFIAQRESFMLPLLTASVLLVLFAEGRRQKYLLLAAAGLVGGLTFVYKFPSLLIFLCLVFYVNAVLFAGRPPQRVRLMVYATLCMLGGFAAAIIPFVAFFAARGAYSHMIEATFGYVYEIYAAMKIHYSEVLKRGFLHTFFIAKENFIIWLFSAASVIDIAFNARTKKNVLIAVWALASFAVVVAHKEFFGYHYLLILPPFCILAGYGLVKSLAFKDAGGAMHWVRSGKAIVVLALAANMVVFAALNYKHYTRFLRHMSGKRSLEWYYSRFNAFPQHEYSFPADYEVVKFIRRTTNADDRIYVMGGIESVIYFLAERKSPSRFIYSWFLFSTERRHVPLAEKYRRELLADLEARPPKCLITIGPLEAYREFADISAFAEASYELAATFPDERYVYVRRTPGSTPTEAPDSLAVKLQQTTAQASSSAQY